jgi:hypothetical protein
MLEKIVKIFGYSLLGLTVLIILHFFVFDLGSLNTQLAETGDLPSDVKSFKIMEIGQGWSATILFYAIALTIIEFIIVIASLLWQIIAVVINDKSKAPAVIGTVLVIGVIIAVSYFVLASSEIPVFLGSDTMNITGGTCRAIETGLYVLYITLGLTFFAAIYSEVSKFWK